MGLSELFKHNLNLASKANEGLRRMIWIVEGKCEEGFVCMENVRRRLVGGWYLETFKGEDRLKIENDLDSGG